MNSNIIGKTEQFVKEYLDGAEPGHNWWHIYRVRNLALYISEKEGKGDKLIIELAALLHDIGDYKTGKQDNGQMIVSAFLNNEGLQARKIGEVTGIMENISFRDNIGKEINKSIELCIVQDADRLDAIGAIGIARAFNYGGSAGMQIYEPGNKPVEYKSKEEYIKSQSSTINHFYEKLFRLKSMMNTDTAKALAVERFVFMKQFIDHFFNEWKLGEKDINKDKR